jgi:hypothetical protein
VLIPTASPEIGEVVGVKFSFQNKTLINEKQAEDGAG